MNKKVGSLVLGSEMVSSILLDANGHSVLEVKKDLANGSQSLGWAAGMQAGHSWAFRIYKSLESYSVANMKLKDIFDALMRWMTDTKTDDTESERERTMNMNAHHKNGETNVNATETHPPTNL